LMVGQSFPSHFRVERPVTLPPSPVAGSAGTSAAAGSTQYPAAQYPSSGVVGSAQYPSPYPFYPYGAYAYDPYYYYSYYYSPFAYPYYWGNSGYYRGPTYFIDNGGTIFVPSGSGGSGSGTPANDNGQGQVVNGRGYTRVHPGTSGDPAQPAGQRCEGLRARAAARFRALVRARAPLDQPGPQLQGLRGRRGPRGPLRVEGPFQAAATRAVARGAADELRNRSRARG
jgi:hypothetical protein